MSPPTRPVALVTGASRGIGRAIAESLADAGHRVVVNYKARRQAADEVVQTIQARGGMATAIQADVADAEHRQRLLDQTLAWAGRLDVLVNNAGITSPGRRDLLEATEDSWDQVLATNLKGPFFLSQLAAQQMIHQPALPATTPHETTAQAIAPQATATQEIAIQAIAPQATAPHEITPQEITRGTIVNISSISAYTASTDRADYCIAKAGLQMVTWLYASRLAEEQIRVFAVSPGIVASDMTAPVRDRYSARIAEGLTPIRRWGEPHDVARAVCALVAGALPFCTGQRIDIDGGFHIRRL